MLANWNSHLMKLIEVLLNSLMENSNISILFIDKLVVKGVS